MLVIHVRSMRDCDTVSPFPEWVETVKSWKAAWAVVDSCSTRDGWQKWQSDITGDWYLEYKSAY